ncbi:unnamed protein product, partial [marine sediment metagenome]
YVNRNLENPTCTYALGSIYVGFAFSINLAYSFEFFMFNPLTEVIRITVGQLKLGNNANVS